MHEQRIEDLNRNVMELMLALLPNKITARGGLVADVKNLELQLRNNYEKLEQGQEKLREKIEFTEKTLEMKLNQVKDEFDDIKQWKDETQNLLKWLLKISAAIIVVGTLIIQILSLIKK